MTKILNTLIFKSPPQKKYGILNSVVLALTGLGWVEEQNLSTVKNYCNLYKLFTLWNNTNIRTFCKINIAILVIFPPSTSF